MLGAEILGAVMEGALMLDAASFAEETAESALAETAAFAAEALSEIADLAESACAEIAALAESACAETADLAEAA